MGASGASETTTSVTTARAGLTAAAVVVFVAHASFAWSRWLDDAFISFRYAERFARGAGMTFNDGERVEGITNLGWALLLSAFAPGDLLLVAKVGGLVAGVGSVLLLGAWCHERRVGIVGTAVALGTLVGAPWAPLHAVSGLETAAAMLAVTAGWSLAHRGALAGIAALAMGLGPWVRPDVALAPIVVGLSRWRGPWDRRALACAGLIVACGAALVAVKLAWFGEVLSNTAHLKLRGHLEPGLWYVAHFLATSPLFGVAVALAGVHAVRDRLGADPERQLRALPGVLVVAWLAAVVLQGGDYMVNFRLLVPVMPAVGAAIAVAIEGWTPSTRAAPLAAALAAIALLPLARLAAVDEAHRAAPRVEVKASWSPPGFGAFDGPAAFPAVWPLVNAGRAASAFTDLGLFAYVQDTRVIDPLGLTDRVMAGRVGGQTAWGHLTHNVGYYLADVQGGLWQEYRARFATGGWTVVGGCGSIWVLANPAVADTPPSDPELLGRLERLVVRAPRDPGLFQAAAWELAAAGRVRVLEDWIHALGRDPRCPLGTDTCDVATRCAGNGERLDPATMADPRSWPDAPAATAGASTRSCVEARRQARAAWEQLGARVSGREAALVREAGAAVRRPDALWAAEAAAGVSGSEAAVKATREAVAACGS